MSPSPGAGGRERREGNVSCRVVLARPAVCATASAPTGRPSLTTVREGKEGEMVAMRVPSVQHGSLSNCREE